LLRALSRSINNDQKGVTAIEMLVATAISSFIGFGIAMAAFQMININARSTNHVAAVKQVESAAYWIGHDAAMAQVVQPTGGSGFPLSLSWVEWDNTNHQVSYTLGNGELRRIHYVNQAETGQTVVAENISSNQQLTYCRFLDGMVTLKVTALVGGFRSASETRMAQVIPRPLP
jgi:hypothetical protein